MPEIAVNPGEFAVYSDASVRGDWIAAFARGQAPAYRRKREGPAMGAWISYALGSIRDDMPAFVVLPDPKGLPYNNQGNFSSGFLPVKHGGVIIRPHLPEPVNDLRPPVLDQLGLMAAISSVAEQVTDGGLEGLHVEVEARGDLDDLPAAVEAMRAAIEQRRSPFPQAHFELGRALFGLGQLEEAIAEARAAVKQQPVYPEAHYELGRALARQGDLKEAIESYRTGIAQREHFPWAYHKLGVALARSGNLDEAVEAYRKAIEQK